MCRQRQLTSRHVSREAQAVSRSIEVKELQQ